MCKITLDMFLYYSQKSFKNNLCRITFNTFLYHGQIFFKNNLSTFQM